MIPVTSNEGPLAKPLPGFESINRYWDRLRNIPAAKILPGECYVSACGELISTVLGSCVAACIRDTTTGIGGMNHFMLPIQNSDRPMLRSSVVNADLCYGNWAMEYLINSILKTGATRKNLEVKLFGGGRVLANMKQMDIGQRNVDFVLDYLEKEGLYVASKDLGSTCPRKILYFPDTGAVKLKRLHTLANNTVQIREKEYVDSLKRKPAAGDVELF